MTTLLSSPAVKTLSQFRLSRHADYQRVYKASRKHHSTSMSYFFRVRSPEELPPAQGPRIGLTVGKVMGKALARNRIKRRLREAVRLHLSILHDAPLPQHNLDLVLHPRKSVATMEFAALEREVTGLFTQVTAMAAHPQPIPPPRSSRPNDVASSKKDAKTGLARMKADRPAKSRPEPHS